MRKYLFVFIVGFVAGFFVTINLIVGGIYLATSVLLER